MKTSNFILKLYSQRNITFPQAELTKKQGGILIFGMEFCWNRGLGKVGSVESV